MSDRYQAVLLFGMPGAGKGTQGLLLANIPGFFHMSTGDMFRTLDHHSEIGRTFDEYSSRGELVPDEVTVKMWQQYVHAQTVLSLYKPHSDLLVLDGIPRTVEQTKLMKDHIDVRGIIHLVAPNPEEMVTRLQKRAIEQKRVDDAKIDVIRNRLDVYERETRPVLDQFDASLVHEVNAIGTPAEVLGGILRVLAPIQASALKTVTQ
jgi:adenylate kinase